MADVIQGPRAGSAGVRNQASLQIEEANQALEKVKAAPGARETVRGAQLESVPDGQPGAAALLDAERL